MYIANCVPVLSVSNRELLTAYNAECFTSVHKLDLKFSQLDEEAESLLGYSFPADDMLNKTLYELLSPESLITVAERHRQILTTKNTKGYLDPIKLLHKSGYYISCLLNMYLDSNGYLMCKYQIMSQNDVAKYTDYVLNFKRDWFLNISPNAQSSNDRDSDDSEDNLNVSDDIFQDSFSDSHNQSSLKRSFDNFNYEYENNQDSLFEKENVKKIKTEFEVPVKPEMPTTTREVSRQALHRMSSADVKINNIKEALVKDCETLRAKDSEADLDFKLDEELLCLLQTDGEVDREDKNGYFYPFTYPAEYLYEQNNLSFYEPIFMMSNHCFIQQQMNKNTNNMSPTAKSLDESFEEEDIDNFSGQFESSECSWLESLDNFI